MGTLALRLKIRKWIGGMVAGAVCISAAFAYDNGPQVLGCDYKLGTSEGTGKCLIVGSGMNQGISWIVFEVEGKKFRYDDSSADKIELLDKTDEAIATYSVSRSDAQCRPGGKSADVYAFANGDRVCLYW
ncbi:MAG: hypothetical protein LBE22_05960 [Azoarcus sp.]|jgi:hypothetical protein|nr:hypothetical protein [Azoarcus sp.]